MNTTTKLIQCSTSGTDQTEKGPGSGDYQGQDQTTKYLKGQSPDRRAVKNLTPKPESSAGPGSYRWEH